LRRRAEACAADFGPRVFAPRPEWPSYRVAVVRHARNAKSGPVQWVVGALAEMTGPKRAAAEPG
jgi:hypothetical protein